MSKTKLNFQELTTKAVREYLDKLNSEKEYLIAAYMAETGLRADQIVLVIKDHSRFYPAPRDPQLDDIEPEIRRWKDECAALREENAKLKALQNAVTEQINETYPSWTPLVRALWKLEAE